MHTQRPEIAALADQLEKFVADVEARHWLLSAMRGNCCIQFQAILRLTSRRTGESQTVRESRCRQSELLSWTRQFW
jgi:hypothetical protein